MERLNIKVEAREETGKGAVRRLRREGKIPGIIYGRGREPLPLSVDPLDVSKKVNSNVIVDLIIEGEEVQEEEVAMIKDYQKDVIKGNLLHVDFLKISMDEKIEVSVPVNIVGTAIGVKEGGVMQQLMREVDIEALPDDIPDEIDLDISELDVGDSLQVDDLDVKESVEILNSPEDVIITIVTPSEEIEEEIEEELEEEFVEPEVIGEETEEEEVEEEETGEEETVEE
ncbi:MAG: 50S ribosomal protein L25 [Halanaerobiales bacterium]